MSTLYQTIKRLVAAGQYIIGEHASDRLDGMEFKAVWSYLRRSGVAKLVTVHFYDEAED